MQRQGGDGFEGPLFISDTLNSNWVSGIQMTRTFLGLLQKSHACWGLPWWSAGLLYLASLIMHHRGIWSFHWHEDVIPIMQVSGIFQFWFVIHAIYAGSSVSPSPFVEKGCCSSICSLLQSTKVVAFCFFLMGLSFWVETWLLFNFLSSSRPLPSSSLSFNGQWNTFVPAFCAHHRYLALFALLGSATSKIWWLWQGMFFIAWNI